MLDLIIGQSLILSWVVLILGFIPLIFGADWLVEGGSSLARRFRIPVLVIGLTIVAFGTSAPELIVNLISAYRGSSDLAMGNILGSNIFNLLLILGISSIIYPLSIRTVTTWIEIPFTLLSAFLLFILIGDTWIDNLPTSQLSRIDGIVLLSFFVVFLAYTGYQASKGTSEEELSIRDRSLISSVTLILLGFIGLVLGGKLIVESAVSVAREMGMSERIIGFTIVAAGTSLPELATSAMAAFKKNTDIAVGNVVGSNIFNVFFILGTTAVVHPIPVGPGVFYDAIMNLFATSLLLLMVFVPRGRTLSRWEGAIFLIVFMTYTGWLLSG